MVMRQLKRGEVVIVYDNTTEIWHVLIMLSNWQQLWVGNAQQYHSNR